MKISIITVSYNNAATIESTLNSVLQQDYDALEYILVDGQSTDGTLGIIDKYRDRLAQVIVEKDEGIYDALNKGIKVATGDVIGILHADDIYPGKEIISSVMNVFTSKGVDSLYGDLEYVDRQDTNRIIRKWKSGEYYDGIFLKGWMPPHPTFFIKRKCYEQYGAFNTILRSAADYELMLRMLHKHKITTAYLPSVLVKMRVGGKSNKSIINRLKANHEDRLAWKINNLKPGLFTLTYKPLSKIRQFF